MKQQRVAIIVPTLNAASLWDRWVEGMRMQTMTPDVVLIIDSSSDDGTVELALAEGYRVHRIARKDFNHGGTRQLAIDLLEDIEIAVFLTQDAILAHKDSIRNIVASFNTSDVGTAYGRQLPRKLAGPIEAHARFFNYPQKTGFRTAVDIPVLGIKTVFTSNSFSAYRVAALKAVGGFPDNVIVSEDMHVAARMVLAGWKIHYNAEAVVEHSHGYTFLQEFRRYFDIGAFHAREQWLPSHFGTPSGEGIRFVLSEWRYLGASHFYLYPSSIVRAAMKLFGFRLGLLESKLPLSLKRAMSMHKAYWK